MGDARDIEQLITLRVNSTQFTTFRKTLLDLTSQARIEDGELLDFTLDLKHKTLMFSPHRVRFMVAGSVRLANEGSKVSRTYFIPSITLLYPLGALLIQQLRDWSLAEGLSPKPHFVLRKNQ
jgi:hypothetical protein